MTKTRSKRGEGLTSFLSLLAALFATIAGVALAQEAGALTGTSTIGGGYRRLAEMGADGPYPALPEGAHVTGLGIEFLWRVTGRANHRPLRLRLSVDDFEVHTAHRTVLHEWQWARSSVILEELAVPRRVAAYVETGGNHVEVVLVRVILGYESRGEKCFVPLLEYPDSLFFPGLAPPR